MAEIAALVLFAADGPRTAAFYRAIGIDLADETHDDGPLHWAAELGDVHVAVYQADEPSAAPMPDLRASGCTFPGVNVDSLDRTLAAIDALGAPILERHQVRPWGCRVIAEDPDGRPTEINQRDHCPA